MAGFTDTGEPTAELKPPQAPEEFSQGPLLDAFNDVSDLMSPTFWMTEAYNLVFGYNPLDEVVEWFSGDWESFAKCGDLWGQLGKAVGMAADNISAGDQDLTDLTRGDQARAPRAAQVPAEAGRRPGPGRSAAGDVP